MDSESLCRLGLCDQLKEFHIYNAFYCVHLYVSITYAEGLLKYTFSDYSSFEIFYQQYVMIN